MAEAKHPSLVEALLDPGAYPEPVNAVKLAETHISYLFLTGEHVYKVKKPVDFGFLDFTTPEKRRYYCEQEVKLNRRMSPEVYLGVVEIREQSGSYSIGGKGNTVEYAVKMLQLPQSRAMSLLLKEDQVTKEQVQRLAVKIADFHRRAATSPEITRLGDVDAVRENVEENFSQTEKYIGKCLSQDAFDDLAAYTRAFLEVREEVFRHRADAGRVRDCHGDLHTAQIFLENGISIIDCIEFNQRFRYSDVAEDIAFLAMDLDFHQRPDLSRTFVQTYVQESGDAGVMDLLDFFKSYRAYVRGKVNSFLLDDPELPDEEREKEASVARDYFHLAHSYAQIFPRPALVLVTGITGTGKSTVAQELARRWDFSYISSDETRKALAGMGAEEHRYEEFGEGIYSAEFSQRTYESMFQQAEEQLKAGRSVVLDGTFRRSAERSGAISSAQALGMETWIIECQLPDHIARQRLESRLAEGTSVSDGRWELYHRQQQEWEPVSEVAADRYISLDTSGPVEENLQELLHRLYINVLR
jgi:aminoglycoside phosphotransferase family enzyme/predicted kinase